MVFTISEIIDVIIMTVIVGYIFSGVFYRPRDNYEPLLHYKSGFDYGNLKFAIMITAPAIILHELAHKFVALSFGLQATFKAAYFFLGLGLLLKLINFGFIFFVPAYVSILGSATPLQFSLIAVAGPLTNLVLWLGSLFLLKYKVINKKYDSLLILTSRINMFLFIFNILPIPGFDGSKFFAGLIRMF